jgi:hypothetical protein
MKLTAEKQERLLKSKQATIDELEEQKQLQQKSLDASFK